MKTYFYPGCKFQTADPQGSLRLQKYLCQKFCVETLGCCSQDFKKPSKEDRLIYVCPTCAAILEESAQFEQCISIYEFLLTQDDFQYPDFNQEKMMIQDCWRICDHNVMQQAVRNVIKKMNICALELRENFEKTKYCGITTMNPPSNRYQKLAPKRLVENWRFSLQPKQKQIENMKLHAQEYFYEKVICYCTGCMEGVAIGGKQPVHLLSLLLSSLKNDNIC